MSGCRRARRASANLLILAAVTALAVACSPAPYEGIPNTSTGPGTAPTSTASLIADAPSTTALVPAPIPPTTNGPPTTNSPPTTVAPPELSTTTRPTPTPTPTPTTTTTTTTTRPPGVAPLGTTGVRITLVEPWQATPGVDPRTLLPTIAEPLAPTGLFLQAVLVATRRDAAGPLMPSVMAFELPRGTAPTATDTLTTLRSAIGRVAAASEPLPEPSRIGEGAYVTYQYTATVNGTTVEVVSEHYAFVRPASVLVVTATTTIDRASIDGRAFGNMLASLALTN